ncbi:hypothetical protein [Bosea sp. BK604]|uniref:hypothetical protein n=1 Tax=Bosea sp. BK604 TaxID=2512180 RepID=UPI0010437488|nr:hypothetical protein [Bosea sp. BK604]TCR64678.1 hypothetical protein EV560_106143 [Bosea sp. BK604]
MSEDDDILEINSADMGDDSIHGSFYGGAICLTIESPWAGCSASGFGRSLSINLSAEQALQFAGWLSAKANAVSACAVPVEPNPAKL